MATPPKKRFNLSSRIWWWVSFCIMIAGGVVALAELYKRQAELTDIAFEDARRVTIALSDGAIEGRPPAIADLTVAPEEEKPEAADPASTPTSEDADASEPQSYVAPEAKTQAMPPAETVPEQTQEAPAPAPTPETPPTQAGPVAPEQDAQPVAPLPVFSSSPMAEAPAASLSEDSPAGPLPVVASDGTKPWQYYAKPFISSGGKPQIAIIVTELGLNKSITELAANLPDTVTLSMSPYAPNPLAWSNSLRIRGHELMLDLPLEPVGYPTTDPGPDGMLISSTSDQNLERLKRVLGRYAGYIGVTIPDQERFTSSRDAAYPVMSNINRRGLIFLLTAIPDKSVEELFKYNSFPYLASDLLIDLELKPNAITQKLTQLEGIAKRQGYAIGIARALPVSIKQIQNWSEGLSTRNIELVPLSTIAKTRYQ